MLPLPELNDQSFENIMKNSLNQIKKYGDIWDDIDLHDPGITIIELFAHLKVLQQDYINNIGSKSFYKLLEILGVYPYENTPSITEVSLKSQHDEILPKGTKFKAYDLIFETIERAKILDNSIETFGIEQCKKLNFKKYDSNDKTRKIYIFGEKPYTENGFYIEFKNLLPTGEKINIHITIYDDGIIKRNPIINHSEFTNLSDIVWEYYGRENDEIGWHNINICEDETYSFLYSGHISFIIPGIHMKFHTRDYEIKNVIRVRLIKYGYEIPPIITNMQFNSLKLIQYDTKCETISFNYLDFKNNIMLLDSYLAFEDTYNLYIKYESGFCLAEELNISYVIELFEDRYFRLGTSDRNFLNNIFSEFEDNDCVFKLVLYSKDFYNHKILGSSRGTANQYFNIESGNQNIIYDSFDIIIAKEDSNINKIWYKWDKTKNIDALQPTSKNYILDTKKSKIKFGNNVTGKVPSIGKDNICIVSFKTTKADSGNIQSGVINKFENSLFDNIDIYQFKEALYGKEEENLKDLIFRVSKIIDKNDRAITVEDYKNIAENTQGLKIKNITVIPLYEPDMENYPQNKKENTVTIVVEPYKSNINYDTSGYIKNIETCIEKAKMITTHIIVTLPQYIGLNLYGEIIVKSNYRNAESLINETLKHYIDNTQNNKLGYTIFYGDICGIIETLDCVTYIKYLKLETENINAIIKKNQLGDIEIPPHARIYLNENNICITKS